MRCASPPDSEPGGPVEREVVEADVEQEVEPLLDLLEHPLGDLPLAVGRARASRRKSAASLIGSAQTSAMFLRRPIGDRHRDRLEPGALAGRARHLAHEALEPLAAGVGLGLAVPALDVGDGRPRTRRSRRARGRSGCGSGRAPWSGARRGSTCCALAGRSSHGVFRSKPSSSPSALDQPQEVVGDVRRGPRLRSRPRRGVALGSGTTSSGSTSIRVPRPWHSGQAPNGRVERERPRLELVGVDRVVVGAGHLLGEPQLAVRVLGVGRSTKSKTTSPPARPSAVSTESVSRRLDDALTASRSTTTSMVCFFCLSSFGGVGRAGWVSPSTRAREKPWVWQLAEQLDVLALAAADHRGEHLEPGALLERRAPGRRSAAGSAARSARRRSGSAGGRRGRRAGGGSRRPR